MLLSEDHMRQGFYAVLRPLLALGVLLVSNNGHAEQPATAQAAAGGITYGSLCANCHGADRHGGEGGPALVGDTFVSKWRDQPGALFDKIRTSMPPNTPGMLSDEQYQNLTVFLRTAAGLPAVTAIAPRPSGGVTQEWLYNRGDVKGTGYSPLDIINKTNVAKLSIAWRWKSDNFGPAPESNLESTPLMVDGVLYTTAGLRRDVVAIDAKTGETLWIYRIDEGERGKRAQRRNSGRGVAYAQIGDKRVIYLVTIGFQLIALDAKTGQPLDAFGQHGIVDLKAQLEQDLDPESAQIGSTSPPLVMNGVVVVGPALGSGAAPASMKNIKGYVAGFDAATGQRLWLFHTVPTPSDYGAETWNNGSNLYTGNTGVWGLISGDPKLGYVYLPIEAATSDYYGGHRHGDDLFSQSLVCLDVRTGKRIWHFQTIHHDIWDYDLSAPPVLIDVKVGGVTVPIVAEVTKEAFTFVLNRVTGKPIWPIIERKTPQSSVPGEEASATQPFPSKPPAFDRQGFVDSDLNNLTPEIYEEAKRIAHQYAMGALYSPASASTQTIKGTLVLPGSMGGANWQGAVADPETGILYVGSMTVPNGVGLVHEPAISDENYVAPGNLLISGPFGLPLVRPPWGRITAIDLNTGNIRWQIANADTPEDVRNHPKLKGVTIPRTGTLERSGLLVTKSLLFAGEGSGLFAAPGGGPMFRAIDKKTGEIVTEVRLPGRQSGVPMTYAIDGKQYIVVAAGNKGEAGELVALTVP
jgi:quinoprotein glucose dehydrogenase